MDISALLTSLVAAKELARGLVSERDARKFAAIHNDLTERLTDVQLKLAEVVHVLSERTTRVHALEDRVREFEQKEALRHRYELAEIAPGVFAYRLKPVSELCADQSEPPHLICQSCLDIRNVKSVLNRMRKDGPAFRLVCGNCDFSVREDGRG